MAQVGILIAVGSEHGQKRLERLLAADVAQRNGCEEAHPRFGVAQQFDQTRQGCRLASLAQNPGCLSSDLEVLVGQQGFDAGQRLWASACPWLRASWPRPQTA